MLRICLAIAIAVLACPTLAQYTPDNPLWHDGDPTNDPNSCHDAPGLCVTDEQWRWGWYDARCRSFNDDACLVIHQCHANGGSMEGMAEPDCMAKVRECIAWYDNNGYERGYADEICYIGYCIDGWQD